MWSGGFVSVWMFLWNKNIWMEMGNKEHTVLLFKRCFLFWPEPGTRDWGSTAGYLQGVSPGHHTQGQANPGTGQTIKTLMNVPSDSSSKRPSQGCHWNLRTLEVAFIPCHRDRICSSVTCGQRRRDSVSTPFSDQQGQLGSPPSQPPRSPQEDEMSKRSSQRRFSIKAPQTLQSTEHLNVN